MPLLYTLFVSSPPSIIDVTKNLSSLYYGGSYSTTLDLTVHKYLFLDLFSSEKKKDIPARIAPATIYTPLMQKSPKRSTSFLPNR